MLRHSQRREPARAGVVRLCRHVVLLVVALVALGACGGDGELEPWLPAAMPHDFRIDFLDRDTDELVVVNRNQVVLERDPARRASSGTIYLDDAELADLYRLCREQRIETVQTRDYGSIGEMPGELLTVRANQRTHTIDWNSTHEIAAGDGPRFAAVTAALRAIRDRAPRVALAVTIDPSVAGRYLSLSIAGTGVFDANVVGGEVVTADVVQGTHQIVFHTGSREMAVSTSVPVFDGPVRMRLTSCGTALALERLPD